MAAKILLDIAEPPLFSTPGVHSFPRTLFAKSRSVAEKLGSEVRSRKSIKSILMCVFDRRHVVAHLGEEGEEGLLVSFDSVRDGIV